jgi:L-fuconolactonase
VEALPQNSDGPRELRWVREQLQAFGQGKYALVGRLDITAVNAKEQLEEMKALGAVGVRQCLNFEPTWPFVTHNVLLDTKWLDAVALLPQCGIFLFEMHCNPHQLADSYSLMARYPEIRFVINHLACYKAGVDDVAAWTAQLARAAKLPNVFIKISNPTYTHTPVGFLNNDELDRMVRDVIAIFTPQRCMAASNYPVSLVGSNPDDLFRWFRKVTKDLSVEDVSAIMWRTAVSVYGFVDYQK